MPETPPVGPYLGPHVIDTGTAELVRDLDRPNAYLLMINEMESSYIDLDDPSLLDFEYLRWMAAIIEHGYATESAPQVVHLGAAACTLVRRLLASRPQSTHLAVDIDRRLIDLVTRWFDLPVGPALTFQIGDARKALSALPDASQDVIVRDVFAGSVTPYALTTVEFAAQAQRVLKADGIYLVNCADLPDLRLAKSEIATLGVVFQHLLLTADPTMLKGRRRGNLVIAGSNTPFDLPDLPRELLAGAVPAQLWSDGRVREFGIGTIRHDRPVDVSGSGQ